MYFEPDGTPCDIIRWGEIRRDENNIRVALTKVPGYKISISTVYIGINLNYFSGPPLIYETMVFTDEEESDWYEWCERHSTREKALACHEEVVKQIVTELITKEIEEVDG